MIDSYRQRVHGLVLLGISLCNDDELTAGLEVIRFAGLSLGESDKRRAEEHLRCGYELVHKIHLAGGHPQAKEDQLLTG